MVFGSVFLLALVSTTQPSSQPAEDPRAVLQRAIAVAKSGNDIEAQSMLQAEDKALGRGRIVGTDHAQLVDLSGVLFMRDGDLRHARDCFDRLMLLMKADRSYVLDHAKIDVQQKNTVTRAAKDLDSYLTSAPNADEDAVNLLGFALSEAMKDSTNRRFVDQFTPKYMAANAKLEQTKPGQHHWGNRWISGAEWVALDQNKLNAENRISQAQRNLNEAARVLDNAKRDLANERMRAMRTGAPSSNMVEGYQSSVDSAQRAFDTCQNDLNEAYAQLPKPMFTLDAQPILPDFYKVAGEVVIVPKTAAKIEIANALTSVVASMPKDVRPDTGGSWNEITAGLAGDWMTKQIANGKPISILVKFESGGVQNQAVFLRGTSDAFVGGDVRVIDVKVVATLNQTENALASKLIAGDEVSVTGMCTRVVVSTEADAPDAISMQVQLTRGQVSKTHQ